MRLPSMALLGLLLVISSPLTASTDLALKELFQVLRANNTITGPQHARLLRALDGDEDPEKASVEGDGASRLESGSAGAPGRVGEARRTQRLGGYEGQAASVAAKQPARVDTKGGLEIATADGAFSFRLGGRLAIDAAVYDEDKNSLGNGTELRRARLEAKGRLYHDWLFNLGFDFARGEADVINAYIDYRGWSPADLRVGHFQVPFGLEELTSSNYISFMERSLPNVLVPGYKMGIGARSRWDQVTLAGGLFGESYRHDTDNEGDEGWGIAGRLTYAPVLKDKYALHFGVAAELRKMDEENEIRFRARPESHVTDVRYLDTGTIDDVDGTIKYGLEAALVAGPFSLQGEYMGTDVKRFGGSQDLGFHGWYGYASWFLTGESRNYRPARGTFGRIKPRHRYGAWELAARYSLADLTDRPISGGQENNLTLGLNWYINPSLRAMANYIFIDNDSLADANEELLGDDNPRAFQLRLQANF